MDNNGTNGIGSPELDLGSAMSKLLENPEMMSRVKELAGMLGGSSVPHEANIPSDAASSAPQKSDNASDSVTAASHPGHTDAPSAKHTAENTALLKALKPYLSDARREKADYLIQMLQLLSLVDLSGLNFRKN